MGAGLVLLLLFNSGGCCPAPGDEGRLGPLCASSCPCCAFHAACAPFCASTQVDGKPTTESNAAFDASLRQRNPAWGYRDVGNLAAWGAEAGLRCAFLFPVVFPSFLCCLLWG